MPWKKSIIGIIGLIVVAFIYYYSCQFFPNSSGYHRFHYTPKAYLSEMNQITKERQQLEEEMGMVSDQSDVLHRAEYLFQDKLTETLFPYWLGTNYGFYGQTLTPGKGKIACGYFVTTTLEDMGVMLDRKRLAKMASEQMIKNLVDTKHIKRYSNQPLKRVLSDITFEGKGVYIVGLDTHTGFLVNDGDQIYFIHASGRRPWAVVKELAENSIVLNKSKYRVTGHLTGDSLFIQKWLEN